MKNKKEPKKRVRGEIHEDAKLALRFVEVFRTVSDDALAFLSEWLGLEPTVVKSAREILENGTAYRRYPKSKPGGGWRTITEPAESLKDIQRALLHFVWSRLPVHYASYAGVRDRSAVTAAERHAVAGKAFFKIDLKNAYPSVGRKQLEPVVIPALLGHLSIVAPHLAPDERAALANLCLELCLHHDQLAQGSPASLHLMNVARLPLDCAFVEYLRTQKGAYCYTAYVDDLIVSRADADTIPERVRRDLVRLVLDAGFEINTSRRKRKIDYWPALGGARRPLIMGLIPHPDGRVTISAKNRRRFRAALHQILTQTEVTDANRRTAAGIMGYLHMVYADGKLPSDVRDLYARAVARFGKPPRPAPYPDVEALLRRTPTSNDARDDGDGDDHDASEAALPS